jgi:hypothetical protein
MHCDCATLVTRQSRAKADRRYPRVPCAPIFGAIPTTPIYALGALDGKQNPFFALLIHCSAPCSTQLRALAPLATAVGAEPCRRSTSQVSCCLTPRLLICASVSQSPARAFTAAPLPCFAPRFLALHAVVEPPSVASSSCPARRSSSSRPTPLFVSQAVRPKTLSGVSPRSAHAATSSAVPHRCRPPLVDPRPS